MKVTLFMVISVNGIIATLDNKEDFLSHDNWETFVELANKVGCIIWGRKTCELVKTWGEEYWKDLKEVRKIVVSSNLELKVDEGDFVVSSPHDAIKKGEEMGFEEIVLTGGAKTNSSFMKENLVNEVILNIEPVIVGKGISLFEESDFEAKLKFIDSKTIGNGILQVRYQVA